LVASKARLNAACGGSAPSLGKKAVKW